MPALKMAAMKLRPGGPEFEGYLWEAEGGRKRCAPEISFKRNMPARPHVIGTRPRAAVAI